MDLRNEAQYGRIIDGLNDIIEHSPDAIARDICTEVLAHLENLLEISHERLEELEAQLIRNPSFPADLIGWLDDDFDEDEGESD